LPGSAKSPVSDKEMPTLIGGDAAAAALATNNAAAAKVVHRFSSRMLAPSLAVD